MRDEGAQGASHTRGLVLGKFLPYHAGHAHLIREARRQVDELVVLVCSIAREPIAGGLRYQWVRASHPDCRVVHVSEEVPQAPEDHPDFWDIWTDLISRYAGPIDRVFTSEAYGEELGRRIGAQHVAVDPSRRAFPVSGTAVRDDPLKHWRFVPDAVRPYLARRVAIVGPESSGKSTLAASLAAALGTVWVPEFGREYCIGRDPREFTHGDFEAIAWGQATHEDQLARRSNGILICDTELHTTCTWSELMLRECRGWLRDAAAARRYHAMLLLGTDIVWTDDGTRVLEARREEHMRLIRRELRRAGRRWTQISGVGQARTDAALAAVRASLLTDESPISGAALSRLSAPHQALARRCIGWILHHLDDDEFQTRLGASRNEAAEVLMRWPAVNDARGTRASLVIHNSLNEVAHGLHLTEADWAALEASKSDVTAVLEAYDRASGQQ